MTAAVRGRAGGPPPVTTRAARPTAVSTRLTAVLAGLAAVLLLAAGPAQAAGYRYWSFWQSGTDGTWSYATQGPATARPADGTVDGYRFAVSADSGDAARPRQQPSFDAVCGTVPAKDGTKRVGVVVDFGVPDHAPDGETPPARRTACAQVRTDATSAEALAAVAAPLRYNNQALLCAITGYPEKGCGERVATEPSGAASGPATTAPSASPASPAASETGSAERQVDGGPSLGVVAGLAAVVALGAAAVVQARRRRR
ncbi:SCO2322 family protein [Streptomyces sp. NPDC047928]|uniref:SCO2322 family protein n=1 Tax=unclassified Streptomyces TaxID=2593676 RepID=UPI0037194AA1